MVKSLSHGIHAVGGSEHGDAHTQHSARRVVPDGVSRLDSVHRRRASARASVDGACLFHAKSLFATRALPRRVARMDNPHIRVVDAPFTRHQR